MQPVSSTPHPLSLNTNLPIALQLDRLPQDWLTHIFSYLDKQGALQARLTCRNFSHIETSYLKEIQAIQQKYENLKKERFRNYVEIFFLNIAVQAGQFLDKKLNEENKASWIRFPIGIAIRATYPLKYVAVTIEKIFKLILVIVNWQPCATYSYPQRVYRVIRDIDLSILLGAMGIAIVGIEFVAACTLGFTLTRITLFVIDTLQRNIQKEMDEYPATAKNYFTFHFLIHEWVDQIGILPYLFKQKIERSVIINEFFHHLLNLSLYKQLLDMKDYLFFIVKDKNYLWGAHIQYQSPQTPIQNDCVHWSKINRISLEDIINHTLPTFELTSEEIDLVKYILSQHS